MLAYVWRGMRDAETSASILANANRRVSKVLAAAASAKLAEHEILSRLTYAPLMT